MVEQFGLILVGMFIGSAIVWFLTRRKVKELEKKLQEENQKSENPLKAFSQKQQEEKQERKGKILELLQRQETITNDQVEKMLGVSDATATNYLQELEDENKIEQIGERGRFVSYRLKTNG